VVEELEADFVALSPYEKGKVFGRAAFEIASVAVSYANMGKIAQLAKTDFLASLKAKPFFSPGGGGAAAINRLTAFLAGLATTKMCFAPGTPVLTDCGARPIETIRPGDLVLARDFATREQTFKPVTETIVTHPVQVHHLLCRVRDSRNAAEDCGTDESDDCPDRADTFSLTCTGQHPFFVIDVNRFVPAEELHAGNQLRLADGSKAEILSIAAESREPEFPFTTYNLVVQDFGTYFVGNHGVWVHNAAGRECQQVYSMYMRLRNRRGKTIHEAFKELENKLFHILEVSNKEKPYDIVGLAVDEGIKDVIPGLTQSIWTNGPYKSGGANVWYHFRKHVRDQGEFPDIDDIITYAERARNFAAHSQSQGSIIVWLKPPDNKMVVDWDTREIGIMVENGADAGKIRVYMKRDPTKSLRNWLRSNGYKGPLPPQVQ